MPAEQLSFLASLDFPGRTTLLIGEIAERLGCTERHLLNQIDSGKLVVLDLASKATARRAVRVPIESYRAYVLTCLTGSIDLRMQFLRDLPEPVRRELVLELVGTFPGPGIRGLIQSIKALSA